MMVNLIKFYFKILALMVIVDIIACRPQEMKRENLVEHKKNSYRTEDNQNHNQGTVEDKPITKFSQRSTRQVEINNLKTHKTTSNVLNAAKRSKTVKRLRRSKRSKSWVPLPDSGGVDVHAWNLNCGFAQRIYLEFKVDGILVPVPANCTVVSDSLILEGDLTNNSGCEATVVPELIQSRVAEVGSLSNTLIQRKPSVSVSKRICVREGLNQGDGVRGKRHICEQQFARVRFKDQSDNLITKYYESGCVLKLL